MLLLSAVRGLRGKRTTLGDAPSAS
jgi:hypothetical protein